MMASVFLFHVVGDLTVAKPDMVEFCETETVEAAIRAIGESTECGIPVWEKRSHVGMVENSEMRQQRFVGILNSLDIVAFLARNEFSENQEKAMKTLVSEVVVRDNSLLKIVDPATRLIDALELMKQGVRRLLVPKSVLWKGMSKRFSVVYNGKWLRNVASSASNSNNIAVNSNLPSPSATASISDKFCCLSREDIIRFLIGCLGALAPIPLTSIRSLGAINPHFLTIEASSLAIEATRKHLKDPSAVAVVETMPDGDCKIIGEISASKLWKCDYSAAAWALANLSAGQFVMGVEDNVSPRSVPDFSENSMLTNGSKSTRPKKFSSRSIGFNPGSASIGARNMYRGRSAPLTCRVTSSLAAVMAQMLSHRATHVWVTEAESDEILIGVVGYADILYAVTRPPTSIIPTNQSTEAYATENQD